MHSRVYEKFIHVSPSTLRLRRTALLLGSVSSLLCSIPAIGGTINTFTGATDNLTGTVTNYSLNSAPINGTAPGSYKDILFTGIQLNLLQTNTNYHSESLSVTNGSSYSIAGLSTNAPTIRVGTTSNTGAAEVIAPFNNANVPPGSGTGSQDLIYLGGNSSLSISNLNNNDTVAPLTVQLRQSGNFNISSGSVLTLDAVLRQNNTQSIAITGEGITNFNAINTYSGSTTVSGGTLNVNGTGSINASSAVSVAAGAKLIYNSSTALTKAPVLNGAGISSRAILGGSGTVNTAVTLDNTGDTLSPGNSPGIFSFATGQTWNSFSYDWELNNFTGTTAGTDFDQIAITGILDFTGSTGSYVLNLLSLTGGNLAGDVGNFGESSQSWTLLSATCGISSFDPAEWTLSTSGFTTTPGFTGTFSLAQSGNDLVLSYAAVPEPGAFMMLGSGIGMLLLSHRTRRR